MAELKRETRINKRKEIYAEIFAFLHEDTLRGIQPLIDNVSFMAVMLEDLQKEIIEKGVVEQYKHGENQFGIKKSGAVDVYNTMIKNFAQLMKQLTDLLPKDNADNAGEKLKAFNAEIEHR
jgi:predicted transcriptional regulator